MVTALSNAVKALYAGTDQRSAQRGWAQTLESGKRLGRLTLWTFLSLLATTTVVVYWGRQFVLERIERTYVEIQTKTSAEQARRIARLLEQELAAGVPPATVQRHLQESLSRSPYDDAGFLCLLDHDATILCHPDAHSVGKKVPFAAGAAVPAAGSGGTEWLTDQNYAGNTHLVARYPVAGIGWQVSVHANYRTIQGRVEALEVQLRWATLPILLGLLVLGTFAVRLVGRGYESRIEDANRALEAKVAARTAALAAASAYYRQIIDAAPSAIFLCDTTGKITHANHQAATLAGRPPAALIGASIDDLWQWQETSEGPLTPETAASAQVREAKLTVADGSTRLLHVYARVLTRENGPEGMFIVQDVTRLKTLEQELLQAQKMEALGTLAGGIAHDFNNILTGILGFAELARLGLPATHTARPSVEKIASAGVRARNLVRQILTFSRRHENEFASLRLNAVVAEACELIRSTLPATVKLEQHLEADSPVVTADANQIHQVLVNLCTNAWHALPPAGGHITVGLAACEVRPGDDATRDGLRPGPAARLTVQDDGSGMEAATLARIFEPFFTTKAAGSGSGLGLAVVHGIVRSHGGAIRVRSAPGQGTTFSLYLPATPGAESTAPVPRFAPPAPAGVFRILVVDDEPFLLDSLHALLTARGCTCITAATRTEALATLAGRNDFDVILSDVLMPGVSLGEFIQRAHQLAPRARLILMTGHAPAKILREAKADGLPILQKPFSLDQLATLAAGSALHHTL